MQTLTRPKPTIKIHKKYAEMFIVNDEDTVSGLVLLLLLLSFNTSALSSLSLIVNFKNICLYFKSVTE